MHLRLSLILILSLFISPSAFADRTGPLGSDLEAEVRPLSISESREHVCSYQTYLNNHPNLDLINMTDRIVSAQVRISSLSAGEEELNIVVLPRRVTQLLLRAIVGSNELGQVSVKTSGQAKKLSVVRTNYDVMQGGKTIERSALPCESRIK